MANGRVLIGFAHPVVALYNYSGGEVSYTNGKVLARGVSVALKLETADDNEFYADDVLAESDSGTFAGGTADLTVDGMHPASERFVLGLPEPKAVTYGESKTVNVTKYGANANPPYLGIGYVVTYQSDNKEIFVPTILTKAKLRQPDFSAETKGEKKDWQKQDLVADLHRDDTENADWKWICEDQTSMAAAVAVLNGLLNVTETEES